MPTDPHETPDQLISRLDQMEQRLIRRFDLMEEQVEKRLDRFEERFLRWMIAGLGTVAAVLGVLIGVMGSLAG